MKGKKKKKEKKARRKERGGPACREHVKVLPRSAGAKEEGKKRERKAREGREEDEDHEEKERVVSGEKRGERLDVVETTKPKRRIGER